MKREETANGIFRDESLSLEWAKEQVGPGWSPLIEKIWDRLPESTVVAQIKEKFGTLRFYVLGDKVDMKLLNFISDVQKESANICEDCGQPGRLREDLGWIRTLCDEHYRETLKTRGRRER